MDQGAGVVLVRDDATLRGTVTGTGPTVLLLHAGRERRAVWAPVAAVLASRGLRTVAWDLRGHGESSGQATALWPVAHDVTAMVAREPDPTVVVGASLGGLAALLSLADPLVAARVAGLVLVDAVPDPDPVRVRAWLDRRGLLDNGQADDVLGRGAELLGAATAIRAPILLVRGGPRSPLPDADVERFRDARPDLAIARVPEAGHLVARDAPDALAGVLAEQASAWLADALSSGESARPER